MQNDQDYYSILGVSRDASAVDIRRAYRALAKALHPDRLAAGSENPPDHDFRAVTEAYETLKDEGRRREYDEDLNRARQVASSSTQKRRPGRAFAAGLTLGIVFAVAGIGGKIYLDRVNGRTAKSQESLRGQKADQIVRAKAPAQDMPSNAKEPKPRDTREALAEHTAPAENPAEEKATPATEKTASESPSEAPSAPNDASSPSLQNVPAEKSAAVPASTQPARRVDFSEFLPGARRPIATETVAGSDDAPSKVSASPLHTPDLPAKTLQSKPAKPVQVTAASSSSTPPFSSFTETVLSLERTIDNGRDGVAAYRLVSLVSSATKLDELSQAVSVATKPETRDLINSRIEALKKPQNEKGISEPPSRATPFVESGPALRFPENGLIEVATGPRLRETILHLLPGNGLVESFSDCVNCPEMVVIPAGQSVMGSRPENDGYRSEEAPAHRISVRKPVAISKHGISLGNWRLCVEAGACRPTEASLLAIGPHVPATQVSWFDAKAYVDWLSQTTGKRYRLLSEAEWEYVARAGAPRETMDMALRPNRAFAETIRDIGTLPYRSRLRRADGTSQNAWGVHAMQENVLEWVEDCWHGNYDKAPMDGSPWLSAGDGDCAYRVVRGTGGAAFGSNRRSVSRAREFAEVRAPTLGFRVARDIPGPAKTVVDGRPQAFSERN